MTLTEVKDRLMTTGLPVAYNAFQSEQALPFIVYQNPGEDQFGADGKVYYSAHEIRIELYTELRDTASEALIENAFSDVFFEKSTIYIDTEKCYETIYELEV